MRFLANARNDRILRGIREAEANRYCDSLLLPDNTTPIDIVIPNESRAAGEVRNRVPINRDEFTEGNLKSNCILA